MDSPASSDPEQLYQDNSESSEEYNVADLVDEDSDEDDSNVYVEYGWGGRTVRRVLQLDCPRLPVPQLPMQNQLSHDINEDTRAWPSNEPCFLGPWSGLQDASLLYNKLETPTNTRPPPKRTAVAAPAPAAAGSSSCAATSRRNPIRAASAAIRALQGPSSSTAAPAGPEEQDDTAAADRSVSPDGTRRRRRSAAGDEGAAEGQRQGSPLQRAASSGRPQGYGLVTALRSAAGSLFRSDSSSSGRASAADAASKNPGPDQAQGPSSSKAAAAADTAAASCSGHLLASTAGLLLGREMGAGSGTGFAPWQRRHLCCYRAFPNRYHLKRDDMSSRAYIGQYSADGAFFVAAYQDKRVRLYDTSSGGRPGAWRLRKDITTRMTRWTITDTTTSPDQRFLVYASISPVAYLVNVGANLDVVESMANVTEVHDALNFSRSPGSGGEEDEAYYGSFGIWSVAWSPGGGEMIAGTNDASVYLYDFETKRNIARFKGHQDDVNAVAYLDPIDPNVLVSGSDDALIMVWDRRLGGNTANRKPQGLLLGHTEGLTHLSARGDGRHLISNGKDQTIKLWDVRTLVSPSAAVAGQMTGPRNWPRVPGFDYRWQQYPANSYHVRHAHDTSLMTYRGHTVQHTLIRAYFSPAHTTGQRYVYAGSADGVVHMWDVVTGQLVNTLHAHDHLVRDCSWHPTEPELTTVSWDGTVISWGVDSGHTGGGGWTVGQGKRKEEGAIPRGQCDEGMW